MQTPHEILKTYWHFDAFRSKQEEIINAVLNGDDCLALLPTGGGKSVCYQVPGLMMDGLCLVISPLIALMEDQITNLKSKGIHAVAINSSMSKKQIDIALDNAIYGHTKFLYVSPERLKTHLFQVRFAKMKVNLIAVDEAHCISQWGYDFRPSYLAIAEIRKLQPTTPVIALTATATPDVVEDIQEKLLFKDFNAIQKSFERKNLIYNTYQTNNKFNRIQSFLQSSTGTGIIYCSTRRKVKELFIKLNELNLSVDYYHAGLDFEDRRKKQKNWTIGETKIMVATNAFGMGIDKADVRFVLHHDIPASLEAYFQEAGRAGRDGAAAVAHLFYETEDIQKLKEGVALKYPPIDTIKRIYNALGNHLQLAIGSGKEERFPIDIAHFADKYNYSILVVYNALKFLELCEFIKLSDNYKQPSQLKVLANNKELYNYQVKDRALNKLIQFILRTEMGIFDDYVRLNEYKISSKTALTLTEIHAKLNYMAQLDLVDYIPKTDLPSITYVTERLADNNLSISPKFYLDRKKIAEKKLESVIHFLTSDWCKSELLLQYFGETDTKPCGNCSSCLDDVNETKNMRKVIKKMAVDLMDDNEKVMISDLISALKDHPRETILENLRWLVDHDEIEMGKLGKSFSIN
ncbi:MAG: RecQ family ATP-dependent DNA helicase [Crocinitomix sp.]|nr:RecQ family ATP-dependent DNA helicase [Crocinitomix sp.]